MLEFEFYLVRFCHYFTTAKEVDLLLGNLEKICVRGKVC